MYEVIHSFKEIEQLVLIHRFGLNGVAAKKLNEIAEELGITTAQARNIEAKALSKLRHPSRALKLQGILTIS